MIRLLMVFCLVAGGAALAAPTFSDDAAKIKVILENADVGARFEGHPGIDRIQKDPENGAILPFHLMNGRCTLEVDLTASGDSYEVTKVGRWLCGV